MFECSAPCHRVRRVTLPVARAIAASSPTFVSRTTKMSSRANRSPTEAAAVGRAGGGESLRDIALPVMNDLQSATTETIHRAAPDGDLLVLVERLGTSHRLRDAAARISGALGGAPWCTGRPGQRPSHQTTMSMNDNAVTRQRPCRSRAFAVVRRQGFEPRTR